ncbi:MAG: alpha-amylase/4-alpha-glucanotransferase domain-containing protein, partial [Anaerolineae bacterium]
MPKHIYLGLAIHSHQPVGNFDFVFAEAYQKAYEPLIAALERHPSIRMALHFSGCLRDWIVEHHPDYFPRIAALVARGQVEIMTGGYYEPILVAIPDVDKLGQIEKLTQAVRDDFGYEPTGLWLAERVWEPHLAKPLSEAGIEYTIVDDTHFKYVGLEDKDLFGYYVTEEQGAPLKIFGTSKWLRYSIPWKSVEEVMEYLRREAENVGAGLSPCPKIAVMGDDGEKFGLWPGTYTHCWAPEDGGPGWMEEFFTALEENSDWVTTIPPGEYARRFPALGRIYLPTASYDEMTEWALPADDSHDIVHLKERLKQEGRDDALRFVKGGFWRNFLAKYPEVNNLHKKMLWVSEKVHRALTPSPLRSSPPLPTLRLRSGQALGEGEGLLDHLWAGQCNCPYWHGVSAA